MFDLRVCMCALRQGRTAAADCPKINYKPSIKSNQIGGV